MTGQELLELVRSRRSIRAFKPDPLTEEQIDALIEAIRWAPSAGNLQSRKFYFITNKNLQTRLARAAWEQYFISEAPLVVVACSDTRIQARYGMRGLSLYTIMDVAASIQNLLLVAHAFGLGTCWVSAFDEGAVHSLMQLPPFLRPVALIPVGKPAEQPGAPPRVSKEEAVTFID
ncbi:MAG TPA: nitroreductase family protein [Bacteroidetes bacterium]|nr:nitroreductase family protein [Bacteroidota bacterium]